MRMPDAFWLLVLVFAALGALAMGYALWGRRRFARAELRRRFGPEYDRAVEETGSGKAARAELRRRLRRVQRLDIRELGPEERARFSRRWDELQARFPEDPLRTTIASGQLIEEVLAARGYEVEDPDELLGDLSVESPEATGHVRAARALTKPGASVQDLRRATLHYREVFARVLRGPEAPAATGALPRRERDRPRPDPSDHATAAES